MVWSRLARIQLKLHGCRSLGKGLVVSGRIHVFTRRIDSVKIGDNVITVSRFCSNPVGITNPCVLDTLMGGTIKVGNNVGMSGVILSSRSSIQIGDYTKLGGNVRIFDHNYHSLSPRNRRDNQLDKVDVRTAPIVIGKDVFIGTSVGSKGSDIGDCAIIATGAVLNRNVPSNEI